MSDKIIHSFQTRRQLNQAIEALAATRSEAELTRAVRAIVQRYPHDLVLAALLKQLDTPGGQLRGGLGHMAALLPQEDVIPALRSAAADRQNSPQVRVTAALLLERFLGEELPESVMSDLDESNEIALQSLIEAVDAAHHNRYILLEYVTQMRQTETEVAFMVMEMMERLAPADRVELLRLIAQDDRPTVAAEAQDRLAQLGRSEVGEAAARALHILTFALPRDEAEVARRSLRKLQFSGVRYAPPPPDDWRAYIGPADAGSNQTLWFVELEEGASSGVLLGFIINGLAGIMQFFASEDAAAAYLPADSAIGALVPVEVGAGQAMTLLQIPFDDGRWLLLRTLAAHRRGEAVQPLPDDLKLYGDLLWQFDAPVPDDALRAFVEGGTDEGEATPDALAHAVTALFGHPAMMGWVAHNRTVFNLLRQDIDEDDESMPAGAPEPEAVFVAQVLAQLAQWDEWDALLDTLEASLRAQAAWLHLSGDAANARNAQLLAAHMQTIPVTENPLLAALVAAGFQPR